MTKAGLAHARGMLAEAAWSASKAPGQLRAFYQRVRARRGMQIAVVAAAGKLAVLCWHLILKGGEYYVFAMPSLIAREQRTLELRAGLPPSTATGKATRSATPSTGAAALIDRGTASPSTRAGARLRGCLRVQRRRLGVDRVPARRP
jgi:hypothetical protein